MRRRNRKRWKKAPQARSKAEKCETKWCRNRKAEKTTRYTSASGKVIVYTSFLNHCWKCRARMLKERCPATYVLNMVRHSARKRNLPFTLTVASFKEFCLHTGYLEHRGNQPGDMTLDRIDRNEGYHIWNLRILTHEENSEQGADNTPRNQRADTDDAVEAIIEAAEAAQADPDNEPF